MQDVISLIINKNKKLVGENPVITKVNVGFTNTIYDINNLFILKICTNLNNEENFKKEINFYNANIGNDLVPKLYCSSIDKKKVSYCYEIIEKINGVSLYNVWHTFSEEIREGIIKQICNAIKLIHQNKGKAYDWVNYFQTEFTLLYTKAKELNIFNMEEQCLLEKSFSKFSKYLKSEDFVLVHNDLHFDNIFYSNGKIKIIDFERSMYAPRDYELAIFFRMVRKPWKFASEETEKLTSVKDYVNIKKYMKDYYKELFDVPYLEQRLAIYDITYFLAQLIRHPEIKELKDDIIKYSKIVALKDELSFDNLQNAKQLMDFMDINIEYGWLDKFGNKHINNLTDFRENSRTSSIDEIIKNGVGTCIEQAKLIKFFFDKIGLENKMYCHRRYENNENHDKDIRMHCFVIYKYQDCWYHFEHSNSNNRGIHKYNTIEEVFKSEINRHGKDDIRELTEIPSIPVGLSFKQFNEYVNTFESIEIKDLEEKRNTL